MPHFYDKLGNPHHFIERSDGNGMRDSTLRDCKKHGWLPSVNGIIDIADKPGLDRAVKYKVIDYTWRNTDLRASVLDMTIEEYRGIVLERAFKDWEESKIIGGEIHEDIEAIFKDNLEHTFKHGEIAQKAVEAIVAYCETDDFIAEEIVIGDGYGGMIDLHNSDFLIDSKSKDISDKDWQQYLDWKEGKGKPPKLAYDEQAMQLAAYHEALLAGPFETIKELIDDLNSPTVHRRCINVFIDRTHAGRVIIHEWTSEEIEKAWKQFYHLLQYWQISKDYYPS